MPQPTTLASSTEGREPVRGLPLGLLGAEPELFRSQASTSLRFVDLAEARRDNVIRAARTDDESGGLAPSSEGSRQARNERRLELIEKQFASGLSLAEDAELRQLQAEMARYLQETSTLPIEALRELRDRVRAEVLARRQQSESE